MSSGTKIALASQVRVFPDFPHPGIAFQDLAPLYAAPGLITRLGAEVADSFSGEFDTVLAVEARGFVLGTAVAMAARCPLVLARKQGKLPGPLHSAEYSLEYGSAVLTVQHGAISPESTVLAVDDVLATGGTLAAAADLVNQAGGGLAGFAVLLELGALGGRDRLQPARVFSLLTSGEAPK
ncbi:adenine phosphoribosyltransferase [Actinoplanes sp. N902-109]|uniref:adenine phosphoribosyltransferase n=1 Tax=Actinoplanes sp. (strain N902-109) TaxID=649831 RepID=UPI00032944E1|nr:adenine phosphoribosyltransferase [Actinoplanes sp. N902-109]AGL15328.1 hypothetical protein L083_1818 [Actinoplanes sp. N902-109]